jgi:hypothetical protein
MPLLVVCGFFFGFSMALSLNGVREKKRAGEGCGHGKMGAEQNSRLVPSNAGATFQSMG